MNNRSWAVSLATTTYSPAIGDCKHVSERSWRGLDEAVAAAITNRAIPPWDDPTVRAAEEQAILTFLARAETDRHYRPGARPWPVRGFRELLQRERRDGQEAADPLLDWVRELHTTLPPVPLTVERVAGHDTLLCWRSTVARLGADGFGRVTWGYRLRLTRRGDAALGQTPPLGIWSRLREVLQG